ncbi:hypothetical protein D5F01_LYC15053 [Larimichthys crocea]|uniref:Uncharacterized protein n=1 Tax=Larimichthys crocea TaxID=215358 RepID=A0A6G0I728_LARCR|nr:hypothetical protein D5F01_LYC15053 [Larimichthys crocea]
MDQSTPHQLINYAMDFHMPSCIKNMVASYFNDLQMCFALQDFTTGCQQLEEGIAMGNTNIKIPTGWKWNAQTEVDQAISSLQHQEIVGRVQAGRASIGWGEAPRFWSKANRIERKEMVVAEVIRMEEDHYKIKATSQGRQGSWTTWEGVVNRISWTDLWKIPQARLSFLIRSTYDILPCPRNLHQWFRE